MRCKTSITYIHIFSSISHLKEGKLYKLVTNAKLKYIYKVKSINPGGFWYINLYTCQYDTILGTELMVKFVHAIFFVLAKIYLYITYTTISYMFGNKIGCNSYLYRVVSVTESWVLWITKPRSNRMPLE